MDLKRKRGIETSTAASPSSFKRKRYVLRNTKKYLFAHTMTRPKSWDNSEETYECKYRFDVNDDEHDKDAHDVRNTDEREGGGIDLLIAVQWEIKGNGVSLAMTREKNFYLSSDELGLYDDSLENQLQGIISPILDNLGFVSSDVHEPITQLLVCSAALLYLENKQQLDGYTDSSSWMPLNVYIVVQIQSPSGTAGKCTILDEISLTNGLRLFKRADETGADEEKVCPICLDKFPVGCELARMPYCHHIYHQHCIGNWLAAKSVCPMCRGSPPPDTRWKITDKLIGGR